MNDPEPMTEAEQSRIVDMLAALIPGRRILVLSYHKPTDEIDGIWGEKIDLFGTMPPEDVQRYGSVLEEVGSSGEPSAMGRTPRGEDWFAIPQNGARSILCMS